MLNHKISAAARAGQPRSRGGRPRQDEARAIDRAVLSAAQACFLSDGYDSTTIEAVAAKAGVTKATVYLRHKDKEALFRAVLADRMRDWGEASRRAAWFKGDTLESQLKHYATSVLRALRNPEVRAFIRLVEGCRGSSEVIAREFHDMLRANMLRRLSSAIARFGGEEGVTARDPQQAARLFMAMLRAFPSEAASADTPAADASQNFVEHTVGVFLRGRTAW
jgi:TetR/AcrR family transcriptional repressor of mexJK operon